MKHAKQALPGLLLTVLGMLLLFSGCSKLNAPEHFQTVSANLASGSSELGGKPQCRPL